MCDQQSLRSACAYAQSDQSLCLWLEYPMSAKLLTEHHMRFLSLKVGCTGLSETSLAKMPHCWKSRVTAQLYVYYREIWMMTVSQNWQYTMVKQKMKWRKTLERYNMLTTYPLYTNGFFLLVYTINLG